MEPNLAFMDGLVVRAIHVLVLPVCKDVDARHKAGHDDNHFPLGRGLSDSDKPESA
jgi:hypothetical protein